MAIFTIDTDSLDSAKSSLDTLANQINSLSSTVSSYDTNCDEFDFSSAKSVIASNLEALEVKIQNTSSYVESSSASHTTLQNNMKFESSEEKAAKEQQKQTQSQQQTYTSGNSYSSVGYTGATHTTSYASVQSPTTSTSAPSTQAPDTTPDTKPVETKGDVTVPIKKIEHLQIDKEKLTDDGKKLFEKIEYNEAGYAMISGMLAIACSETIGKVGDIVEFTMKDGSKVRCIILENIEVTKDEEEIHFFTNDKWDTDNKENDISDEFNNDIEKIDNYGAREEATEEFDASKLPEIGKNTKKITTLNEEWNVVTTKIDVSDYAKVVSSKKISQTADTSKYSGACLAFSYVHASNMYNGVTSDTAVDAGNYKHASEFETYKSDNKTDTLNRIYSELVQGRPVVMQVNGNTSGTSRHFVTVVGFRGSITDPEQLTEEDLLIMDSWDGKVERMDQDKSRFMTTGKQTGKEYSGYYLRTLKPKTVAV